MAKIYVTESGSFIVNEKSNSQIAVEPDQIVEVLEDTDENREAQGLPSKQQQNNDVIISTKG